MRKIAQQISSEQSQSLEKSIRIIDLFALAVPKSNGLVGCANSQRGGPTMIHVRIKSTAKAWSGRKKLQASYLYKNRIQQRTLRKQDLASTPRQQLCTFSWREQGRRLHQHHTILLRPRASQQSSQSPFPRSGCARKSRKISLKSILKNSDGKFSQLSYPDFN